MRRPLDWILSISLLVLVGHQVLADSDPTRPASVPVEALATIANGPIPHHSPFAWIREDGSEVYLPATGAASGARVATTEAVFTWTLPMATPATSASPSWR